MSNKNNKKETNLLKSQLIDPKNNYSNRIDKKNINIYKSIVTDKNSKFNENKEIKKEEIYNKNNNNPYKNNNNDKDNNNNNINNDNNNNYKYNNKYYSNINNNDNNKIINTNDNKNNRNNINNIQYNNRDNNISNNNNNYYKSYNNNINNNNIYNKDNNNIQYNNRDNKINDNNNNYYKSYDNINNNNIYNKDNNNNNIQYNNKNNNINYNNNNNKNKEKTSENKSSEILNEAVPFKNDTSTNNCFLNVSAQILYHTKIFNKQIYDYFLDKKIPEENANPIYKLQYIFYHYKKYSKIKNLNYSNYLETKDLRNALNNYYNGYYAENEVGDPIDVINNLFNIIHNIAIKSKPYNKDNSAICNPSCLVHKLFAVKLKEITQCTSCKISKTIQYDNNYFIHNIFVNEILDEFHQKTMITYQNKLFNFVKKLNENIQNEIKLDDCKCKTSNLNKKLLLCEKISPFLILNLTWFDIIPNIVSILKMYSCIPYCDYIYNLFELENTLKTKDVLYLYGIIHYYNGHFTCSFRSEKNEDEWYFIDDYQIKKFFSFKELIENLIFNHYHPTGLFYCAEKEKNIDKQNIEFTEDEYKKLYAKCYDIDRMNNNIVSRLPSSKLLISIERQNSSTKKVKFENDKWICPNCKKKNLSNSIKCWQCHKVFSSLYSEPNEFSVFNQNSSNKALDMYLNEKINNINYLNKENKNEILRTKSKKSKKENESEIISESFDNSKIKYDVREIRPASALYDNKNIKKKKTLWICKQCNSKNYEGDNCKKCSNKKNAKNEVYYFD